MLPCVSTTFPHFVHVNRFAFLCLFVMWVTSCGIHQALSHAPLMEPCCCVLCRAPLHWLLWVGVNTCKPIFVVLGVWVTLGCARLSLSHSFRCVGSTNGFFVAQFLAGDSQEIIPFFLNYSVIWYFEACFLGVDCCVSCYSKGEANMSEDIDKHVLRKYHVGQKLGKGVSVLVHDRSVILNC